MARKIKQKSKKKKVRGYRQQRVVQQNERLGVQRRLQAEARRRRLTRRDVVTGEEYILARLALKDKGRVGEYRDGLAAAVGGVSQDAAEQAEAIRGYLQAWVDDRRLVPIACGRGEKPVCRIYGGERRRVVVIRQDDADAGKV